MPSLEYVLNIIVIIVTLPNSTVVVDIPGKKLKRGNVIIHSNGELVYFVLDFFPCGKSSERL